MGDQFYMKIKMSNGAEFEYKQDSSYPIVGTTEAPKHNKDRVSLLDSIDKITSYLIKEAK